MSEYKSKQLKEKILEDETHVQGLIEQRDASPSKKFNEDQLNEFDATVERIKNYKEQLATVERIETFNRSMAPAIHVAASTPKAKKISKRERNNALRGLCLRNTTFDRQDFRDAYDRYADKAGMFNIELRDQSTDTSGEGEDLLNGSLFQGLDTALKAHGGVRSVANVIRTENGTPIHFATCNDTSNVGGVLSELASRTQTALAFDRVTINSYLYSSGVWPVSYELIQDASIDIGNYIGQALGERLARATNADMTTANGSSKCTGFLYSATLGATSSSTSAFDVEDIWDLYSSVDVAYRNNPSCVFMMHDSIANALRKLESETGSALWGNGLNGQPSDTLIGKRVVINNNMPTAAASAKVIAFGDFSKFYIRDVKDVTVKVEDDPAVGGVNFYAYLRCDSKLVDSGTHPIKYLQLAAPGSGG